LTVVAGTGTGKTRIFLTLLSEFANRFKVRRYHAATGARGFGIGRGLMTAAPDFDDPLPPDVQELFEN